MKDTEYQNFNQYKLVYDHPTINEMEARNLLDTAYRQFIFSKFKNIFFLKNFYN